MAGASADASKEDAAQASLRAYNPQLTLGVGPRFAGGLSPAFQVSLLQTIELGGKRDARRALAQARIESADAERFAAGLTAEIDAWRTYQLALVGRERVAMAAEAEQVAVQVAEATLERQKAGFGTQLEVNLATAEVGRARHDRLDAEGKQTTALATLASAIGAPGAETIELEGTLGALPEAVTDVDGLVARARDARPEARAARASANVANAEVSVADAGGVPDLTVGVSYQYEKDPELTAQTVLGTVSINLPVINRNQGARRSARVLASRAKTDVAWTAAEVEREVRVAVSNYQRAREAVLGFSADVNERLHENLELARASYSSGKIDYLEFNVVRRELLASRAAYLDAFAETIEAWSTLQRATGGEVTP